MRENWAVIDVLGSSGCRNTPLMLGVVLAPTRRVKEGPDRRSQSAKQQRFTELRARGYSIAAARRKVGVSRSAAANWTRGDKICRNGQVIGFVEPSDRLAVKAISPRYLPQDERVLIADLLPERQRIRAITLEIDRAASTASRELARDGPRGGPYRPFDTYRRATSRRAKPRARRLETDLPLRRLVGELLTQRWSPARIARHLHVRFPQE